MIDVKNRVAYSLVYRDTLNQDITCVYDKTVRDLRCIEFLLSLTFLRSLRHLSKFIGIFW